ncbi:hypothetical protein M513_13220 [Trichuris suis]|uniref:Uncharacterized protein n=1 Tax=Trichuris suis TaxID=68888 RepID=A0A085LLR2_9BILA|nr:hypothetical protein M513_13220 [Trichuris suis]
MYAVIMSMPCELVERSCGIDRGTFRECELGMSSVNLLSDASFLHDCAATSFSLISLFDHVKRTTADMKRKDRCACSLPEKRLDGGRGDTVRTTADMKRKDRCACSLPEKRLDGGRGGPVDR